LLDRDSLAAEQRLAGVKGELRTRAKRKRHNFVMRKINEIVLSTDID
jgi:hypothetical protein